MQRQSVIKCYGQDNEMAEIVGPDRTTLKHCRKWLGESLGVSERARVRSCDPAITHCLGKAGFVYLRRTRSWSRELSSFFRSYLQGCI